MSLPDEPTGECPVCGALSWEYTEYWNWQGHRCDDCDAHVFGPER